MHRFFDLRYLGIIAVVMVAGATTRAQTVSTGQQDRVRMTPPSTPFQDSYSVDQNGVDATDHAAQSPNDTDLGEQEILKRVERYQPFSAGLAMPFYYTSNVALVRRGEKGDFLIAPIAGFTYAPRITKTFFGDITIQDQQFIYSKYNQFDFGSFDIRAGFTYLLPQLHDLVLQAHYDYNRLNSRQTFNDFFSDHSIFLSAELPFHLDRAQQISLGVDTSLSFAADPDLPQRNEFDIYVGYHLNVSRSFSIDTVGRIFIRDYHEADRTDVSEVLAVSANWHVTKWLSASAISTFAWSQSNHDVFSYNVANIGGAIGFTVRF
jgi:hypothetical protein